MKPAVAAAPTPAPATPTTNPSPAVQTSALPPSPSRAAVPASGPIVASFAPPPSQQQPSAASDSSLQARKNYTDVGDNFVVSVPLSWTPGSAPPSRLALVLTGPSAMPDRKAPPIFRAQVGGQQQQPGQPPRSIDDFSRDVLKQITKNRIDSTMKIEPAKVDGVDARQFMVTLEDARGMDIDMKYVITLRPPHSFIFTYLQERGLFDSDEADAIFSSIRWMKSPGEQNARR
jgi:hypothetical protein